MAGNTTRNVEDPFEGRIVACFLTESRVNRRIMEDKRRRGEPLDDHLQDAILATAASHRPAVATQSTGEPRNTGFATVVPWTARPR